MKQNSQFLKLGANDIVSLKVSLSEWAAVSFRVLPRRKRSTHCEEVGNMTSVCLEK